MNVQTQIRRNDQPIYLDYQDDVLGKLIVGLFEGR